MREDVSTWPLVITLDFKRSRLSDEILEASGNRGRSIDWIAASVEMKAKQE